MDLFDSLRVQLWAVVKMVMNLRILQRRCIFLTIRERLGTCHKGLCSRIRLTVQVNLCPRVACGRITQFLYVPVFVYDHKPKCRRIIETVHVRAGINMSFLGLLAHIILLFGHALILL